MLRCVYVLLFLTMFYAGSSAQVNYQMSLDNGELIDSNTFEFNVFLKSMDSTFQLTSYQCSFTFYVNDADDSSLSFSYIQGSSELNNRPSLGIGLNVTDGVPKLTFASMPGSDYITSKAVLVGRFRLQNTDSFEEIKPSICWSFEGKIATILTGSDFVDITNLSNHFIFGTMQCHIVNAISSIEPPYPQYSSDKAFDGKGYYYGDQNSRWAAKPIPQSIIFDLGTEIEINLTRFSFYEFQNGRTYEYSVSLSDDMNNWNEVVTNDTSGSSEWTENAFSSQIARYVKLNITGCSIGDWADLWEAQIWREEQSLPTELCSYTGLMDSNDVVLNWLTSSERNNSGFDVERQTNDGDFELIGFVEGNGTTNEAKEYSFTDKSLTVGKYSYRLKQIDFEGNYNYSDTLDFEISSTVDVNELGNAVYAYQLYQNYPNPFNPQTTIRFDIKEENLVILSIYNILGEKVKELIHDVLARGSHEVKFDGSELSSGIYICRLDVKNEYSEIKKMSLLK